MKANQEYQQFKGLEMDKGDTPIDERLEELKRNGYFIVPDVFDKAELIVMRQKMDETWELQRKKFGDDLLKKIVDWGQVRAMMETDPYFCDLILHPQILKYVDAIVGDTAILHLQNGIILHPSSDDHTFTTYHKDFPKDFISTKVLSFNAFIAVDEFSNENGGTWVIPGSHLFASLPTQSYIKQNEIQLNCDAGSIVYFDSTLWHKGGRNRTDKVRRAINQQYTRPFIKPQLDFTTIMKDKVDRETKLAQKLGFWSMPPKSVAEYRVADPSLRSYRGGQG